MRHSRRAVAAAAALGLLLLLTACGSGEDEPSVGRETLTNVLSLDFEHVAGPLGAGVAVPSALAAGPGAHVELGGSSQVPLRLVAGRKGRGHGVAFPTPCPPSPEPTCPKTIIEVENDPALNPGTEDYAWGASILLEADETSKGSNIVQKGFSVGGGSQWKLQVDGKNGHPSCVVVGEGEDTIHDVYADVTVADGTWHDVTCRRDGVELVITVDGKENKSTTIPKALAISPAGPVRIGGKSLKPNNDQYFGTLDDVFVATAH